MTNKNRIRGCIVGGAVGDALGYTVEFMQDYKIFETYGEKGISDFELINGVGLISDDTQMTLFTADGILLAKDDTKEAYLDSIYESYRDWVYMQLKSKPLSASRTPYGTLHKYSPLYESRAAGTTCIQNLMSENRGSIAHPKNTSKGCGGVMRVAPIALAFIAPRYSYEFVDTLGAEAAALTHGHDLGFIPAAMLVHIIKAIFHSPKAPLRDIILEALDTTCYRFENSPHITSFRALMDRAISLSKISEIDDLEAIRDLGEGWVAEETLAIAVYCSLKYDYDFKAAIVASVNHSGDSDSTGAVTGNILGAYLGLGAIPKHWRKRIELKKLLFKTSKLIAKFARKHRKEIIPKTPK